MALLKTYDRKEALWDSNQVARVCERVIELEESNAVQNEIPERSRVVGHDLTISEEGAVQLVYRREALEGDDDDSVILAQDNLAV